MATEPGQSEVASNPNGFLFCAQNSQGFAISGRTYLWPVTTGLTWGLGISRLGPLNDLDLKGMYADIWKEIASVIDFNVTYNPNARAANFLVTSRRLDGPSGTLAQAGIPMPSFDATSQLLCEWDDSEAYGLYENPPPNKIDAYRVGLHETLHWLGLGHGPVVPGDRCLIEPTYNAQIRHLQPRDKKELLRRYAPAKGVVPAPPTQPPTEPEQPGQMTGRIEVTVGGRRYAASGILKPI